MSNSTANGTGACVEGLGMTPQEYNLLYAIYAWTWELNHRLSPSKASPCFSAFKWASSCLVFPGMLWWSSWRDSSLISWETAVSRIKRSLSLTSCFEIHLNFRRYSCFWMCVYVKFDVSVCTSSPVVGVFLFSFLTVLGSAIFALGSHFKGTTYLLPLMLTGRLLFGSGNGSLTSMTSDIHL